MNLNLASPWGDECSPPQTPFLSFYSPQAEDMLFDNVKEIEIVCQAGLRTLKLDWTLHRNMIKKPFLTGEEEGLPDGKFRIKIQTKDLIPGFYDLRITLDTGIQNKEPDKYKKRPVSGVCTFGWKVKDMAICETRPADFTKFWDEAKTNLSKIPLDPKEGPMQSFAGKEINDYNAASACLPPDYDPKGHKFEKV
ncbi:MAG: hypothetical protein WC637_17240, partial [Victivallales bacterium]